MTHQVPINAMANSEAGSGEASGNISDFITHAPVNGATLKSPEAGTATLRPVTSQTVGADIFTNVNVAECRPHCSVLSGLLVSVDSEVTTPNINFQLERSGSIEGQVKDRASGSRIAATVEIYDTYGNLVGSVYSNGSYRIDDLPAGKFNVYADSLTHVDQLFPDVSCHELNCAFGRGETVTVKNGAVTSNIDLFMNQGGILVISPVIDSESSLSIPAWFQVWNEEGGRVPFRSTSSDGIRSIAGLPTGYYLLGARSNGYIAEVFEDLPCQNLNCDVAGGTLISITEGESSEPVEFALHSGGTITGKVDAPNPDGESIYLQVRLRDEYGRYIDSSSVDSDGNYAFLGLASGNYYVTASSDIHFGKLYPDTPFSDYCGECNAFPFEAPVAVTVNETTANISFELEFGGEISGNVTDGEGRPVQSASLRPYDDNGHILNIYYRQPDENGDYHITGLPPGEHHLRVSVFEDTGLDHQLYGGVPCPLGCDPFSGQIVPVTAGELTPDINFVLTPTEIIAIEGFEFPSRF